MRLVDAVRDAGSLRRVAIVCSLRKTLIDNQGLS
jgi:hypothetical protein